ncbi:MAG: DUF5668 domain-containing protein [Vicinamibacterales bacterium]|nr:DUF5668 domain-containing protein [Vicinamibacterales bacterium]
MNGSDEQNDVPMPPPTPPDTPPAAPPIPPPQLAVSYAAPTAAAARARGLQPKSPLVACLLSLMPGVGQLYVGYYKLGFIHNLVFSSTIALLNMFGDRNPLFPIMMIFLFFFFIYNVVDAGRRAVYYNLALDGVEGVELPSLNVSVPSFGGSIGGGVALIAVGFILLLNTRFGVSLDWIEEWWPAAPILVGAYLLIKAIQERGNGKPVADAAAGDSAHYSSEPDSSPLL